jgi:hypothetical protein
MPEPNSYPYCIRKLGDNFVWFYEHHDHISVNFGLNGNTSLYICKLSRACADELSQKLMEAKFYDNSDDTSSVSDDTSVDDE